MKKKAKFHYKPPQKTKLWKRDIERGVFVLIALLFVVFVLSFSDLRNNLSGFATVTTNQGYKIIVDPVDNNVVMKLDLGSKQTNGVYLEMSYDKLCSLIDITKVEDKLWNEFKEVKCEGNILVFGDATITEKVYSSEFEVFRFPKGNLPETVKLKISKINVYDFSNGNDLFEDKDYEFDLDFSPKEIKNEVPSTPSAPSGGGGGGGTYCKAEWECTSWSYCNNQLKQERICYDQTKCKKNYVEPRPCAMCDESWQCSKWSDCSYNQQTRKCSDEHKCGLVSKKPVEKKSCTEIIPEQPQQEYQPPGQEYQAPQVQQPVAQQSLFSKYFSKYKNYLIAVPFVLLFIVILVVAVLHFTQRKGGGTTYNYNELKDWIKKERAAGSNDEEIKQILAQNTGWNSNEVSKVLGEAGQ